MIWAVGGGRGINLCPNSPKFRHPTPSGAAFPEKTKETRVGQGGISHLGKRKKKGKFPAQGRRFSKEKLSDGVVGPNFLGIFMGNEGWGDHQPPAGMGSH